MKRSTFRRRKAGSSCNPSWRKSFIAAGNFGRSAKGPSQSRRNSSRLNSHEKHGKTQRTKAEEFEQEITEAAEMNSTRSSVPSVSSCSILFVFFVANVD